MVWLQFELSIMMMMMMIMTMMMYNVFCSAPGGDLQTLIDGDLVPLEGDVVHFVRQLVEGLVYLHERNIAHLDIKVKSKYCHIRFIRVHIIYVTFFPFERFFSSKLILQTAIKKWIDRNKIKMIIDYYDRAKYKYVLLLNAEEYIFVKK